ncbi:phospholipase C, phosphocholine-specific [Algoriphagus halophytocola]|uniref:phospholipase C n=1 Tax=Algoriphagus halophytocola TaxID=2991499 RepID=A0ABY6MLU7_9BACT|nr:MULTISPECIES: phospholipase C, phosphocholine-specific [unclassified Algoriphagus]UZD24148.1 phospholipase C, phosphocholine-specific [Algoriphagus sp. TR-M5]WBL41519.1 phospholipase C, phosphocholine-specific [Algoriphagus sp. TR-M9]
MNDSRREFLKKAALVTGGASIWSSMPMAVQRAMAIPAAPGTTFYDAEHVVMLMQENRSFDHCFGTMKGVRGFNDPRAISLPDQNPVWLQPDKNGNRFAPFRFDIKDTKATWMSGTPHSWENQVDARNEGKYDGWIEAKRPGKQYYDLPLTMGFYSREDLPFYYALADAFTVCDQHFCAALTGTTTNRSYFWTGKTHGADGEKAKVRNGELTYGKEGTWRTFPELLEDNGVSWKVYQNELSISTELEGEAESLLANFTDNNLEWFSQFGVRFHPEHYLFLQKRHQSLPSEIAELKVKIASNPSNLEELEKELKEKEEGLAYLDVYLKKWNAEEFEKLSERSKNLHKKAFQTNIGDPNYHQTEKLAYQENGEDRETLIPKGDILHQFRKDVKEGTLPTVTWLVAPQKFSDHPSAPWYGAWYASEVMNILTEDPEVWKKTIFIINYDENDGYFDHVPPFVPPNPHEPNGKMSDGLSSVGEFVTAEEELKDGFKPNEARTSPVGLGYRVPLIIASPWSRGGWVNSEVCDITSTIQFLEKFLSKKTGKKIEETNISSWRRTVSGDLTSAFRPYNDEKIKHATPVNQEEFVKQIYNAKFKNIPTNFIKLTEAEAKKAALNPRDSAVFPKQEPGTKPSNGLKYDLHADGELSPDGKNYLITFTAAQEIFEKNSLGSAFNVYAPGKYRNPKTKAFEPVKTWAFAVKSGDSFTYEWPVSAFENGIPHLRVYGPNGFFREFMGNTPTSSLKLSAQAVIKNKKAKDELQLLIRNTSSGNLTVTANDAVYLKLNEEIKLAPGAKKTLKIDTKKSQGWYEINVSTKENPDLKITYAGRLETGKDSISDPQMGRVI